MHDHVEKFCDEATREGVDAMIRQRRDGFFLQNHIFSRVFPEANKYVNRVAGSDNFEAIRASSATISALLRATDTGEMMATMTMTAASTGNDDNDDNDDDGTVMTTTTTMTSINNEAIQKVLAIFNSESQRAVEYVIPPNEVLREGYE